MTKNAMIKLSVEQPNRMLMTVDDSTGQVELAEDLVLSEAKYCIGVLAKHVVLLSDRIREYNELHLEQ